MRLLLLWLSFFFLLLCLFYSCFFFICISILVLAINAYIRYYEYYLLYIITIIKSEKMCKIFANFFRETSSKAMNVRGKNQRKIFILGYIWCDRFVAFWRWLLYRAAQFDGFSMIIWYGEFLKQKKNTLVENSRCVCVISGGILLKLKLSGYLIRISNTYKKNNKAKYPN